MSLGRGAEVRPERPLGQGLGLSSMTSAAGPQARLQAQAITNLGPIYWNDPSWLFGILGDLHYTSPSSLTTGSACVSNKFLLVFATLSSAPALPQKLFSFWGWVVVRVKADLFPLVWMVSAAKLQPPFSSPALRSLHGRPDRSGSTRSTDLQSLSLPLSLSSQPRQ